MQAWCSCLPEKTDAEACTFFRAFSSCDYVPVLPLGQVMQQSARCVVPSRTAYIAESCQAEQLQAADTNASFAVARDDAAVCQIHSAQQNSLHSKAVRQHVRQFCLWAR